ncbi:ABC transporter permease [Anaerolineae bacterium CFX7]|nr:ABC transporter permease [Anaerolineae bacterium CFX7]
MFGMVATSVAHKTADFAQRRRWIVGGIIVVVGLLALWYFAIQVPTDELSKYRFSGGGDAVQLPIIELPTAATNWILSLLLIGFGVYHLVRGLTNSAVLFGVIAFLLLAIFLTWSIRGASLNLTGLMESTLIRSIPFLLGALSGIMCERSGIINIAIEGMMLTAAFVSVIVGALTGNLWIALVAGVLSGALIAGVHAVFSIQFKVDQIISGTVINIFAVGLTNFLNLRWLTTNQELNNSGVFAKVPIPFLADIPVLGTILFNQIALVYIALILMFAVNFLLYKTRWGLRTRAVGEHPKAADTLGVNVFKIRYVNVIFAGMLAALGGAFLTLGSVGRFDKLMTNGRGFIALAAMIFGNWNPFGSFGASLLFGFMDSLQLKLQILTSVIPSEILLMAPYLATMIVLAGVVGRVRPPAAEGIPYEKQ